MTTCPRIASLTTALPPYVVEQHDARELARDLFGDMPGGGFRHLETVFDTVHVERRNVCAPPEWFREPHTFGERNDLYQQWAVDLGQEAAHKALADAGMEPADVGSILFVSTTGLATPTLDVRLANRLGIPGRHLHRQAIFGRGCAGGVVGLAQAADRARLDPSRPVLLVVVELCSLTYRKADLTAANVVSTALFGDGAAAAVVTADSTVPGVELLGSDGVTWPDTEEFMGWEFGDDGMSVELSRRIPALVRQQFRDSFDDACQHIGVAPRAVDHHLAHPGSWLILDQIEDVLGLGPDALRRSRDVLREHGNMSAATVLFILERLLDRRDDEPGDVAVLSAMGPGFSAEHLALRC